ncbi:MAG: diguanylate cyclase [Pseudohongiellaceae bacterium]|nr:diguanylate cyclase [Pseudohongiellaceae bacterium]
MSSEHSSTASLQKEATILVVDDQSLNIQVINALLSPDYNILAATSGAKAIELCQKTKPDLILMDVVMPQKSGWETCRELKLIKELESIPVIFVTGLESEEEENTCWDAGGVDFIKKPVNATTLKQRVKAHLKLKFQSDFLRNMAFVDGLTCVYNRRFFDDAYDKALRQHARDNLGMVVGIVDVDYFKRFNDRYGHLAGDDCLRSIAKALRSVMRRPHDVFARYGGEEFACILPETDLLGAQVIAKKMLEAVRRLSIPHEESPFNHVTVSIGFAAVDADSESSRDELLAKADENLYKAKQSGRDRAVSG